MQLKLRLPLSPWWPLSPLILTILLLLSGGSPLMNGRTCWLHVRTSVRQIPGLHGTPRSRSFVIWKPERTATGTASKRLSTIDWQWTSQWWRKSRQIAVRQRQRKSCYSWDLLRNKKSSIMIAMMTGIQLYDFEFRIPDFIFTFIPFLPFFYFGF